MGNLAELSQLERLVKIRALASPDTENFADFVEKAVAQGVPVKDIQNCMWEYLERDDIRNEVLEINVDGGAEFSKRRGWEHLWTLAATAPLEVGRYIAWHARLEGRHWKIDLEKLMALPDELKQTWYGETRRRPKNSAMQLLRRLTSGTRL